MLLCARTLWHRGIVAAAGRRSRVGSINSCHKALAFALRGRYRNATDASRRCFGLGQTPQEAARQAVRLYLPGSRLRVLRPANFSDGVAPVLARLRDLFASEDYLSVYGEDDYVVHQHPVLLRQPRMPVLWLDFGELSRRAAAAAAATCQIQEECVDEWLEQITTADLGSSRPPAHGPVVEHFKQRSSDNAQEPQLNSFQWKFLDTIEAARATVPDASQLVVLLQNYDAPFLTLPGTKTKMETQDIASVDQKDVSVVATRCFDMLTVLGRLAAESSFLNYTLSTGEFRLSPAAMEIFQSQFPQGAGNEATSAASFFLAQPRDLSLDLSHNDIFGHSVGASELESALATSDVYWFGGTAVADEETPLVSSGSDMNEAHSANLEAFGGLSHAALVDIAVALTTYRREKEYVDATFVPTVCGRGDAPLDWAALLVQAGILTLGRRISRMDEFHAFAFTHLCFAGANAKRQFLRHCVKELLPEPGAEFPSLLPWVEEELDHRGRGPASTAAFTPETVHRETVEDWCSFAARAALKLAQQTGGDGSSRDGTAAALMACLLLSSPQAVPLPFTNMDAESLQDAGNIDTFSPLSDAEVELPDTVPVVFFQTNGGCEGGAVSFRCNSVHAVPKDLSKAVETAVRAALGTAEDPGPFFTAQQSPNVFFVVMPAASKSSDNLESSGALPQAFEVGCFDFTGSTATTPVSSPLHRWVCVDV